MADPYVHEVTMIAPDIIRVQVNDPPIRSGAFVDLGSAQSGAFGAWLSFPDPTRGGVSDYGWIMGKGKRWVKFQDALTGDYFARAPAKVAANYLVGGVAPTSVHYECRMLERGFFKYPTYSASIFKHYLHLKMAAPLVSGGGPYLIEFPAGTGLADYSFDFNDRTTRCPAIHASFIGHRPGDELKLAYLDAKVFGLATPTGEGIIAYPTDYSISTFEIVNRHGVTVWDSGTVTLRQAWNAGETSITAALPDNPGEVNSRYVYASSTATPVSVVSITVGATTSVTVAPGHGLSEGDFVRVGYLYGMNNIADEGGVAGAIWKVTSLVSNTFVAQRWSGTTWVALVSTGGVYTNGARLGDAADKLYKTYEANTAATNVYGLDYSAFAPTTMPGRYAIRLPGVGISDYFEIDEHVWGAIAKKFMKYEYNQRIGCALDGRFGLTRPVNMRNGVNGFAWYKSKCPHAWSNQGNLIAANLVIGVANIADSSWMTTDVVDAGGGHKDAGDWDTFPSNHLMQACRYMMMSDICPEAFDATDFNLPLTSTLEGSTWSNIDAAPSIMHAAVWSFLWMARCMESDGRVPGGECGRREASSGPSGGYAEPSWLCMQNWYTFLPEPRVNFIFAGCAAMFSRLCAERGMTAAATYWLAKAELAFAWAEDVFRKLAIGESTTSRTIVGSGEVQFSLVSQKNVPANVGDILLVEHDGTPANFMQGTVTTRTDNSITINVTSSGGSGTIADWLLKLAEYDKNYYFAAATGIMDTVTFTGDTHSGTYVLDNLSSTAGLSVGMQVTGTNINNGGSAATPCIIRSIDSASQLTLRPIADQYGSDGTLIYSPGNQFCTGTGSGITFTACHPQAGWSQATFDASVTALITGGSGSRSPRVFALGALARAMGAGGAAYRTKFEYTYRDSNFIGYDAIGRAEYARDPLANSTIKATITTSGSTGYAAGSDPIVTAVTGVRAYRYGNAGLFNLNHHGEVQAHSMVHAMEFVTDEAKKTNYRKVMAGEVGHTVGANNMSLSYLVDSSLPRTIVGLLDVDSFVCGPNIGPDGITSYGPAFYRTAQFGKGMNGFLVFGNTGLSEQNLVWQSGNVTLDEYRVIEPYPAMKSTYDIPDSRWDVDESEFGATGSAMGFVFSFTLHGYDGNTQEEASPRRVSMTLQGV